MPLCQNHGKYWTSNGKNYDSGVELDIANDWNTAADRERYRAKKSFKNTVRNYSLYVLATPAIENNIFKNVILDFSNYLPARFQESISEMPLKENAHSDHKLFTYETLTHLTITSH